MEIIVFLLFAAFVSNGDDNYVKPSIEPVMEQELNNRDAFFERYHSEGS